MKRLILATAGTAFIVSGCVVEPARVYEPQYQPAPYPQAQYQPAPEVAYQPPAPQPVVSVVIDPPLVQPAPVMVAWAPPPMLVEAPPPMPFAGAFWVGGFWAWEGNWVWAHGHWAGPPQPGYTWVNPYYENRGGGVVFVNGFWAAPHVAFVPPPMGISIAVGVVAAGVVAGPRCVGPEGVFVPAPPGSHMGLIVPAPIGTAPAVVTSAPPIVNQGMHITTINNTSNITNITNITKVTVVAPPGSTANGQAFNSSVPVQPHLAAAMTPVVQAAAPQPTSSKPIPAYVAGHQPAALPPPQIVHTVVPASYQRPAAASRPPAPQQPAYSQPQPQHGNPPAATAPQYEQRPQAEPKSQPLPQPQQRPVPTENMKPYEPNKPVVEPHPQPQPQQSKPQNEHKEPKTKEEEEKREHEH